MAISLSMYCGIDPALLIRKDVFDPVLDIDTRLFLDPHLLKHSQTPEFVGAYGRLQGVFSDIARLLIASNQVGDLFWRQADRMMQWPEVRGLCIGYSSESTDGSGIGSDLRAQLLRTAKQILTAGINDPEIFELVGMFQERFGSDRISDMTANIIRGELEEFTLRILGEISGECIQEVPLDQNGKAVNPLTGDPLLLVPRNLLRDIPVALDWSNIDYVAEHNDALREAVNRIAGESWRQVVYNLSKSNLRDFAIQHPDLISDAIGLYRAKGPQNYDFTEDRAGEVLWLPAAQAAAHDNPLRLQIPEHPSTDDVYRMVVAICEKFKSLIENNGLAQLLYDSNGHPKHEKASQLLFYGIAEAYCHANGIMIARESDSGRGPVDFKFGSNMQNSVLVEVKKSTNTSGLKKGIESQLPEYMNAEGSKRAVYLVIDVGYTKAAIKNLNDVNTAVNGSAISILHVSGEVRPSASRLHT